MSVEITVPVLGESIVEATIGQWLKHEGDTVAAGEPVVALETDKVNMEVPATEGGVLQRILKQEGDTVTIGEALALIEAGAASEPAASEPAASEPAASEPAASEPAASEPAARATASAEDAATLPAAPQEPPVVVAAAEHGAANDQMVADDHGDGARATPLARRIAEERGVDLHRVKGTGPSGRVTQDDVTTYLAGAAPHTNGASSASSASSVSGVAGANGTSASPARPAAPAEAPAPTMPTPAPAVAPAVAHVPVAGREEERVRMSRRRQTIARRLVEAQHNAAMLTTFNEVDMSAIMELRTRRRDAFKARHAVGLGYMSFFTRAVVGALEAFPRLNAEIQGDEIVLKHYYDIGVAVSTEEGLVVPVVRDADRLGFAAIEREIASLAVRARTGKLSLAEIQGGTFTITNGGTFGSLLSTPILNAPQSGILGMHKIQERPIALNGQVVIRPMMYLAVSYDHRIVDGAEAVSFLVRVKELLEDPETLLLEG